MAGNNAANLAAFQQLAAGKAMMSAGEGMAKGGGGGGDNPMVAGAGLGMGMAMANMFSQMNSPHAHAAAPAPQPLRPRRPRGWPDVGRAPQEAQEPQGRWPAGRRRVSGQAR